MQAQPSTLHQPLRITSATVSKPKRSGSGLDSRPRSRSRASFLAEASKRLAASLELDVTVGCMSELGVPELGEACMICVLSDGPVPAIASVTTRHVDPQRHDPLTELGRPERFETHDWQLVLRAAQARCPLVLSQLSTAVLLGGAGAPHVVLRDLGLKTSLLVPVVDREAEHTLAVVVFFSERTRHYGASQLRLAEDLCSRFALALEAAQMYRACQNALEDSRESLATTVHDLMSPLTYIKGTAQRLRRLERGLPEATACSELRARLEAIDSASNRMATALTELLQTTSSRPQRSAIDSRQMVDLVEVARRAVAEQQLVARHHSIRFRDAPRVLEGAWNASHVERMLSNLISNAVKYSPPGRTVDVSLACELDDDREWAVLRVSDQGLGIPAEDLPFVFQPYHRGSNVGSIGGNGLGMASVWRIVKTHDGRMWVDSQEGKGTCVTVRLPRHALKPASRSTEH